jgi:hypothetical protein
MLGLVILIGMLLLSVLAASIGSLASGMLFLQCSTGVLMPFVQQSAIAFICVAVCEEGGQQTPRSAWIWIVVFGNLYLPCWAGDVSMVMLPSQCFLGNFTYAVA